jgi:hypothetical protein
MEVTMRRLFAVLLLCLPLAACGSKLVRSHATPADVATLDLKSPFLKAHLRGGAVYVLGSWWAGKDGTVVGTGSLLDAQRIVVDSGTFSLPADSVVLFETNVVRTSGAAGALTVLTGISVAVTAMCIVNPKACFGSCPTFYVATDGPELALQAEGFSSSIAPALEATDVDMLYHAQPRGRDLVIRVTNEALETHVIRHMDVLAVPRPADARVFATATDEFREARRLQAPSGCQAPEGDCAAALATADGVERWSETDSTDLATREYLDLTFAAPPAGELGVVITSRQTLLTTFLIYQALAYMGRDVGRWLAALESGGSELAGSAGGVGRLLGGIDVLVPDGSGGWTLAGTAGETGPLASDTRVVLLPPGPVPAEGGPVRVRLRLTRGLWRLDQVVLATMGAVVEPVRVRPHTVRRDGAADRSALRALLDPSRTLVTMPGDALDVSYRLPSAKHGHELFLESRGYYLEWMRQEWIAEEDPILAMRLLVDPAGMLRLLAPAYKRGEAEMEGIFWGSRYAR